MKKAISLIEVMVSVIIITFVIGVLLDTKNQNLFFLERFNEIDKTNSLILMYANDYSNINSRDEDVYLKDIIENNHDEIRRDLKDIKISVKDEIVEERVFEYDNIKLSYEIIESTYKLDDKHIKNLYIVKFN